MQTIHAFITDPLMSYLRDIMQAFFFFFNTLKGKV